MMTRTRIEQPLAERLRALRAIRDTMLADAEAQPEAERDATRAYAYALFAVRTALEKWIDRNKDMSSVALGSCILGAATQVVQTALLVTSNDRFDRGETFGRFIQYTASRLIEEGLILPPQEAQAQMAKKKTAGTGGILGPDGRPVRIQ